MSSGISKVENKSFSSGKGLLERAMESVPKSEGLLGKIKSSFNNNSGNLKMPQKDNLDQHKKNVIIEKDGIFVIEMDPESCLIELDPALKSLIDSVI